MKVYSCFFLFTATDDSSNVKCYPSAIPRPLVIRVAPLWPHREMQPADVSSLLEDEFIEISLSPVGYIQ